MLYFKLLTMEINLNCDLGEKSKHHSNENDPELLKIVNSANIACGYHAGDEQTMKEVVKISKANNVSIGATRYLNLFFIYFLKILIIVNLFQISIISNLKQNLQLVFLFFASLISLDLIDYYHQIGQFIWREIFVFFILIMFFQTFITPKYTNIILATTGPISCL